MLKTFLGLNFLKRCEGLGQEGTTVRIVSGPLDPRCFRFQLTS